MCRVFDSAALLLSCVIISVGQLKQLMLTVVHWPATTAFCQLCAGLNVSISVLTLCDFS